MIGNLRDFSVDVTGLALAVADWLRCRYRRALIDRMDARVWSWAVQTELPKRVYKPASVLSLARALQKCRKELPSDRRGRRVWHGAATLPNIVCQTSRRCPR